MSISYDAIGADVREPQVRAFFIKERNYEVIQMALEKPLAHKSVTDKKELKVRNYEEKYKDTKSKPSCAPLCICGVIFNFNSSSDLAEAGLEKASGTGVGNHIPLENS